MSEWIKWEEGMKVPNGRVKVKCFNGAKFSGNAENIYWVVNGVEGDICKYKLLDQPSPVKNDLPAAWDLVISDMQSRDKLGEDRYGVRLQPHNGRDTLRDAYEEALDLAVYLRTLIYERNGE